MFSKKLPIFLYHKIEKKETLTGGGTALHNLKMGIQRCPSTCRVALHLPSKRVINQAIQEAKVSSKKRNFKRTKGKS
jgi:hypothetical protein